MSTALVAGVVLTPTVRASFFDFFGTAGAQVLEVSYVDFSNAQTVTLLQGARNIDPKPSRGGGEVVITDNSALVAETAPFNISGENMVALSGSDQISLHVVDVGDSLSKIAEMYGVSVNTIVWANELSSDKDIKPGQTLLILPVSGVQHVVKKGDSVKSLAKKYSDVDNENLEDFVEEIISYNDLSSDGVLAVGETITIPGGQIEEVKPVKKGSSGSTSGTYTKVVSGGGPSISGYYVHPVPGSVKTQGIHGYNAIDFGAPHGTPIRAAAGGRVIVSRVGGWNGGYGNYIVIDHPNGTQTLYSHNSKNTVGQGQTVVSGQVIGYVGSTGRSTGSHLHFEVRGAKNPF